MGRTVTIMLRSIITDSVTVAAKKLRIGRPALSAVLNGRARLSMELAIAVEDAYGYLAESLLIAQMKDDIRQYRQSNGSKILPVFCGDILKTPSGKAAE